MTRDLISGVISSLLVVLFVEGYLRIRRSYSRRSLRLALGSPKTATVVASVFPSQTGPKSISLMGTHDAYAMAHILAAYNSIGVRSSVVSVASLPDGLNDNIVCIGGPFVNRLTRAHLRAFCPAFESFETPGDTTYAHNGTSYRCGTHEFVESEEQAWGFLVRLTPRLTGRIHLTTLVWGIGALGTSGASYFLAELHRRLPKTGDLFVAVPIQRAVGYRGVSTSVVDISAEVWAEPPPATRQA